MEVTKSQKRLLIILLLVVVYALYDFLQNKEDYEKMYSGKGKKQQSQITSTQVQLRTDQSTVQITKLDLNWDRDPFFRDDLKKEVVKAARVVVKRDPKLELQAITYSEDNSFVIINDIILTEGEYVLGHRVERIDRSQVILSKDGKQVILTSK